MSHSAGNYRTIYEDLSKGATFLAADDFTSTGNEFLAVRNASYTIFVQKVWVNVAVVDAATLTIQDDASTPVVVAKLPGSAALGNHLIFDGGDEGVPVTEGKNLDISASAAGLEGSVHIEGYQKLTAVLDSSTGASNQ